MINGAMDLFCGIGGLPCGLEKSGIDVIAGFDVDNTREYSYTHNNNAKFINKNIEDITAKEIEEYFLDMI